jgi:hypothetical protein
MVTNPATILFDINGNAHSVIDGYAIPIGTPSLLNAGVDDDGYAANIRITRDLALKIFDITKEKTVRYDIGTNTIYIGFAVKGSVESDSKWLITRTLLDVNGNPTEKKISDINSIWNNRLSISYY